jgi:hypothetical protein
MQMENVSSTQPEQLKDFLAQRVDINRADLVARYLTVLRESLFSNRAEVRPSILKSIASEEADTLLKFLRQSGFSSAERGEQLHQAGFNAGAILKLSQVTRQFLLNHLENHQIAPMLEIVDTYQVAIIEGFVQSIDKTNLIELERVRNALQRGDS